MRDILKYYLRYATQTEVFDKENKMVKISIQIKLIDQPYYKNSEPIDSINDLPVYEGYIDERIVSIRTNKQWKKFLGKYSKFNKDHNIRQYSDLLNDIRHLSDVIKSGGDNIGEGLKNTLRIYMAYKDLFEDWFFCVREMPISELNIEKPNNNSKKLNKCNKNFQLKDEKEKRGRPKGSKDPQKQKRDTYIRERDKYYRGQKLKGKSLFLQIQSNVKVRFKKTLSLRYIKNITYE